MTIFQKQLDSENFLSTSKDRVRLGFLIASVVRGRIYSRVRPFYEQAVSNLERSLHRSLWA